jgi:NTE family protein
LKELKMVALMRQAVDPGHREGKLWARMRIHRIASDLMTDLGASSKLNAEWAFLCKLRDEGRRCAEAFIAAHGADLGARSTFDIDELLDGF